jgi:hypothetical protein
MHLLVDSAKKLLEKGVLQVLYVLFDSRKGQKKTWITSPSQGGMGNIRVGVQGNTMPPLQSAQYGGPCVGCSEERCMHHTIGSKCTWLSSHYGHTTQWGALQTRTTMIELMFKTMPCVPKAYKLLWALRKG